MAIMVEGLAAELCITERNLMLGLNCKHFDDGKKREELTKLPNHESNLKFHVQRGPRRDLIKNAIHVNSQIAPPFRLCFVSLINPLDGEAFKHF